jgi:vacuolar-type H+-ATPase subunit E/Vma4
MPENLQKIDVFRDVVFNDASSTAENIRIKAEQESVRIVEQAEDEFLRDAYYKVSENTRKIKNECKRKVSKSSYEAHKAVLAKRNEIVNRFFDDVKNELSDFADSGRYSAYLVNKLLEVNSALPFYPGVVIHVAPKDRDLDLFAKSYSFLKTAVNNNIKIGGFKAFYPKEKIFADVTLDRALADARAGFSGKAELRLDNIV